MPSPSVHDSDLTSYWRGDHYQQSLLALQESLLHKKSLVVFTGDTGVGKTTVVRWLIESLADELVVLVFAGDQANEIALYNSIAKGFGLDKTFTSKIQFFVEFSNFLYKCNEAKSKVLLVIDDCHLLNQDLLETIRQIGNIEIDGIHPLHLLLVGNTSFLITLDNNANKALKLSLAMKYQLNPLELKETAEYVNYRLESVGCLEKVFCLKGIELIHRGSQGMVQKINTLCEQVLSKSAAEGKVAVELSTIYESIDQLGMASYERESHYINNNDSQAQNEKNILKQPLGPPPSLTDFTLPSEEEPLPHSESKKRKKGWWVIAVLVVLAVPALWWVNKNHQLLFPKPALIEQEEGSPVTGLSVPDIALADNVDNAQVVIRPLEINEGMAMENLPLAVETVIPKKTIQSFETSSVIRDEKLSKKVEQVEQVVVVEEATIPEPPQVSKKEPSIKKLAVEEIIVLEEQSKIKAKSEHVRVLLSKQKKIPVN